MRANAFAVRARVGRPLIALLAVLLAGCPGKTSLPEPAPGDTATPEPAVQRSLPAGDPEATPGLALGTQGAVTSAEAAASLVGLSILRKGGNAVDAAVAVGFALAVTHPSAGNLGGGGFMVIRMADGTVAAIDYREKAPGKASRDMYLDDKGNPTDARLIGPKAAGIPGTVAGLALAHEKFGKLAWKDVVLPAVELARNGHPLDAWHVADMQRAVGGITKAGFDASTYAKPDGTEWIEGDVWKQPALAATLETIATKGARAFYEGPLAQTMAREVSDAGGIWTAEDLAGYQAREREPIVFDYRGHEIITMPPPSAGGVVLRQLLAAAEVLEMHRKPWRSVDEVHYHVESMRRTYADRNLLLGDPDFVDLPLAQLLDVSYIAKRVANIDPNKATPSSEIGAGIASKKEESHETTHFSVVDAKGNAVSNTYTLNLGFGARWVAKSSGVLLNNEMDDFSTKPGAPNAFGLVQGEPNKIEPGKRMLSSMTPTIVVKDGALRAVLGTPGGPTITTTVAQIARAIIDYGLTIDAAVDSVRVHHQWLPDMIRTENRIDPELEEGLVARGHQVTKWDAMGHANCIEVDPPTKGFRAYADVSRDGGKAVAY